MGANSRERRALSSPDDGLFVCMWGKGVSYLEHAIQRKIQSSNPPSPSKAASCSSGCPVFLVSLIRSDELGRGGPGVMFSDYRFRRLPSGGSIQDLPAEGSWFHQDVHTPDSYPSGSAGLCGGCHHAR